MQELAHLEPEVCPKLETKPHHGSWKKQRRVKGKFAKGMAGRSGNLSGLSKKEQAWRVRRQSIHTGVHLALRRQRVGLQCIRDSLHALRSAIGVGVPHGALLQDDVAVLLAPVLG